MKQKCANQTVQSRQVRPSIDQAKAAVKTLIAWAGDDPEREGLRDTPECTLAAYEEFFAGYGTDPNELFKSVVETIKGYNEIVLLKNISLLSHCEHHMTPIIGHAHVAYLPDKHFVGIGCLARVVDAYAKRLQIQERMTQQIAHCINEELIPKGVAVIIETNQHCMSTRGIQKTGAKMVTRCLLGKFQEDPQTRAEFMNLIA